MNQVQFKNIKRRDELIFAFQITEELIEDYLDRRVILPSCIEVKISDILGLMTVFFKSGNNVGSLNFGDWVCKNAHDEWFFIRASAFDKIWMVV